MLLKVKFSNSQAKRLEYMVQTWFAHATEKDYVTFYNLTTFIRKLQKKNLNGHFTQKESVSVSLNPNEYQTVQGLFIEFNITDPYDLALVCDFNMQTDKQYRELESRANVRIENDHQKLLSDDIHRLT